MIPAIILAGGLGTRLRSVVPDLPKPMARINGRPFLEYQLDYWIAQGIGRFILSVGYKHEIIVGHFGNMYKGTGIEYVIEESPLGTGGGLLLAAEKVGEHESCLVLNGDTYFAVELKKLIETSIEKKADWCFSLFRTNEEGRYLGINVLPDGKIVSLKTNNGGQNRLANGGVYWVNQPALFGLGFSQGAKVSLEDDIFPAALASGQLLVGIEFSSMFIDIGIPADYQKAATFLNCR